MYNIAVVYSADKQADEYFNIDDCSFEQVITTLAELDDVWSFATPTSDSKTTAIAVETIEYEATITFQDEPSRLKWTDFIKEIDPARASLKDYIAKTPLA